MNVREYVCIKKRIHGHKYLREKCLCTIIFTLKNVFPPNLQFLPSTILPFAVFNP